MKLPSGISDGDYTSLYFKDAENQYEQIEGESKYGLRNMKDSLLKELKRDLMKLVKVDKAYSEMHRKSKPVPVRPGLALGVITLQVLPRPTLLSTIFPYTAVYVGFRSDLKFMYDTMIVFNIIQRGLIELHEGFSLGKNCPSRSNFQISPAQVFLS